MVLLLSHNWLNNLLSLADCIYGLFHLWAVDDLDAPVELDPVVQVFVAEHPRLLLVRLFLDGASLSSRLVRTDHARGLLITGECRDGLSTHRHPRLVELLDHDPLLLLELVELLLVLASLLVLGLHTLHIVFLDTTLVLKLSLCLLHSGLLLLSLDFRGNTKFSLAFLLLGSFKIGTTLGRHLPALSGVHAALVLEILFDPHFAFSAFPARAGRSHLTLLHLLLASLFKRILRQLFVVLVAHV